jgi:uncharacterized membrane protein YcgQ (UPF0703/DUF1980 family)
MLKICCICNKNLEFSEYHNNKLAKDGKAAQCKSCAKAYAASKKGTKYPSHNREYANQYYADNKEHILELRKENYIDTKDEINRKIENYTLLILNIKRCD